MSDELKYILKGVFYVVLLFTAVYTSYCIFLYKKEKSIKSQPPVISYNDLMNLPEVSNGKILFEQNCASCHHIKGTDEMFFGKIADNTYDKKLLYAWIRNGDSVLASGNVYYNELLKAFNNVRMTSFPDLTEKQLDDIMSYIKVEKTF